MGSKERNSQVEKERLMALVEAKARGLTDDQITIFGSSNWATLGEIIRERASRKYENTETFASSLGIPQQELRAIYFGFAKPNNLKWIFPMISQELGFKDREIGFLRSILPSLFAED